MLFVGSLVEKPKPKGLGRLAFPGRSAKRAGLLARAWSMVLAGAAGLDERSYDNEKIDSKFTYIHIYIYLYLNMDR